MEDIFIKDGSDRYTIFPIKYPKLWQFYKDHEATFWTVEEVRLSDDLADWKDKLTENERFFIKNILAFFASSDGIVNENLVVNFYNEIQIPEARNFFTVQMMIESIHNEMYSVLIDTYIVNSDEKDHLFRAAETIPAVKKKADWAVRWISDGQTPTIPPEFQRDYIEIERMLLNSGQSKLAKSMNFLNKQQKPLAQRLIAFICIEGIFFSGSFCALFWLKNRGLMPGLGTSNSLISKDEAQHTYFSIELYSMLSNKLSQEVVYSIFKEAVEIEQEFVSDSLPVSLIGMNCDLMKQYIEYVADRWLVMLDYPKLYNTPNPFNFMELVGINTKASFFEVNVDQYRRVGVGSDEKSREISFDDDF
jgi:ribonucleoside-diphosphate reductase beta chain